ncbi:MAG: hypothetical protein GX221_07605 [Candidatus Riflebacteria bacterium]|nr:hypothetical protein [Candidatus Riflebacteria bacterium]
MPDFASSLAIIKGYAKQILTYKAILFMEAARLLIMPLIIAMAWLSVAENPSNPYNASDYIFYYLLVPLVQLLTHARTVHVFSQAVRDGSLSRDLIKPYPVISKYFLESAVYNFFKASFALPLLLLGFLLARGYISLESLTTKNLLCFLTALFFAFLLRFCISSAIGFAGFWLEDVVSLNLIFNGAAGTLMGGMVVPVETLPEGIRLFANFLPYKYMLGFPLEVLNGKSGSDALIFGFLMQFLWTAVFYLIMKLVWSRGLKHYSAYGG